MQYPVRDPKKQPLKRKPLRGLPTLVDTHVWNPDIVRFKNQTVQWLVRSVDRDRIYLERYNERRDVVRKTIPRADEYRLEVIHQPPRAHDLAYVSSAMVQRQVLTDLNWQRPRS